MQQQVYDYQTREKRVIMEKQVLVKNCRSGYERPPVDNLSTGGGDEVGSIRDDNKILRVQEIGFVRRRSCTDGSSGGNKRAYNEIEDRKFSLSEPNKDCKLDDRFESARAEMEEVRKENQRLKTYLSQIIKDYRALEKQFHDTIQQEETKKPTSTVDNHGHQIIEEPELVSLSLGRFSGDQSNRSKTSASQRKDDDDDDDDVMAEHKGLCLALDCKLEAPKSHGLTNSNHMDRCEEKAKEEAGETWQPDKAMATATVNPSGEEETVQQNPLKKARVCVRAKCDTPTMNDGCQWRKYGQKIAKGNPCPRAYYRCTVAPSCPVRKQVQRCADDMSILITTYEGNHNHPLPYSATAMASTTSAAASMLLSGSSSSSRTGPNNSSSTTAIPAHLHGLNFYMSGDSNSNPKQFYIHNSSHTPSSSHPTITLDLTTSSNPSSHIIRSFSSLYSSMPKLAPTSTLNFGSSESSMVPWSNGFFSHGKSSTSQSYNKNPVTGNLNVGRSTIENNSFQSYMQNRISATTTPLHHHQQPVPDTIAAATKAITADPNFQSALVAALTSIIGTGSGSDCGGGANLGNGDNLVQKWGDHFPVASNYSSAPSTPPKGNNACATSYISTNSQPGSLMFLPPKSLPFSSPKSSSASPKSSSASPNDIRDHTG